MNLQTLTKTVQVLSFITESRLSMMVLGFLHILVILVMLNVISFRQWLKHDTVFHDGHSS